MTPDDKPFTPWENIMKNCTLRNSKEALVAAVAALSLVSAVATVSLAPQMAQAADAVDSRTVTVRYSDLNLNTEVGVAALYNRIRHAAEQVCGKVDSLRLDEVATARPCVNHSIASSVGAVGNAQLTTVLMAHVQGLSKPVMVASQR
jgi:UrcA family protein